MKPYLDKFIMAPSRKRGFVPLFLILSLSSLFLFSLYHASYSSSDLPPLKSSLPSFHQNSLNHTSSYPNDNNNNSFTFTIKVLGYNRIASLSRCLLSLANADYGQDRVNLHIFIDHFQNINSTGNVLDEKLNQSRRILEFVDGFSWKFGEKMVHYRTTNVGLQAQWLESWWPGSDHEFAFVVEDDLQLSPLYYKFLRGLIEYYYYNASNYHPSIYGVSLQRPRFVPGKHGNKLQLDSDTCLFLYQLVGTWGQLLFPRPWKEFRLWYDKHKAKDIKPFLQGMVTTGWYKRMGERIWTPWFIKFIHARGYFNLYTNFLHERALSISHRDAGVNYGKTAGPDSYLLDKNSLDFNLLEMQPLSKMKWYDFCFRQVVPDRVVRSFSALGPILQSYQKQETVVLVSLHKVSEAVARNLLCHFERLNIQNYVLMGPKSHFLVDLARRGHPVIDEATVLDNMQAYKLMDLQEASMELIKEILVKAYTVKYLLELGYNVWVIDGNTLPISPTLFLDSTNSSNGFYIGNAFRIFFARSSLYAKKIWVRDFINQVVAVAVKPLKDEDSSLFNGENFVYMVAKVLKQKGVKIKSFKETGSGVNIYSGNVNQTSFIAGKEMVFWPSVMGFDLVQKRLEELGMWMIDSDFSCTAVVCHQS